MNAIYKIIGDNGQEYGPATGEQIRAWIAEGRVERRTPVFVEGSQDWNFVGLLPEFAACFPAATTPPPIAPPRLASPGPGRQAKTNSYAQAGMIFGILSVTCCCGFPFGVLGLVFSLIGLSQINAEPHVHEGRGMAIAGVILSSLSLLMGAGWMFLNLAINHPHVPWNMGHF